MDATAKVEGIVLAGTYHWSQSAFERLLPRPLLPVAQTPLICYALRWMRDGGIARATVCANSASRAVRSYLGDGSRLSLSVNYLEDWTPRGAAGCVRDAGTRSDAQTFVVADGTAIPAVNLKGLLTAHRASGAALTIVVHDDAAFVAPDQRMLSPGGIYVFERKVLDMIPATSFQDIKESLIPQLYRAGELVGIHRGVGACPRILNAETYLAVNQWMIQSMADGSAESGDLEPQRHRPGSRGGPQRRRGPGRDRAAQRRVQLDPGAGAPSLAGGDCARRRAGRRVRPLAGISEVGGSARRRA
jgi:mannose-1-phosphate guanylyltransferase